MSSLSEKEIEETVLQQIGSAIHNGPFKMQVEPGPGNADSLVIRTIGRRFAVSIRKL